MGTKQRRRREKEHRRQQILDAARILLFENGLKAVSVNRIARRAELAVGTIYFYFRSKEEIFAALQEEGLTLLLNDVRGALAAATDARESLHNIAQAYLNFSREQKDYFDVINYFLSSGDVLLTPEIKQQVDRQGNRILRVVEQTLQRGVDKGQFRISDVRRHALLFWVILHGLVPFRKMKDTLLSGDSLPGIYRFAVDHFINGLSEPHSGKDCRESGSRDQRGTIPGSESGD